MTMRTVRSSFLPALPVLAVPFAFAFAFAGCAGESPNGAQSEAPPTPGQVEATLSTFEGSFDALTGEVSIASRSAGGLRALATLPEGSGADQVVPHTIPGSVHYETGAYTSCTSGNPGDGARLCGDVQIISGYGSTALTGVSVVIDSVTGTGNAAFGAPFAYSGTIPAKGTSSTLTWTFSLATPASFSFKGHVVGTLSAYTNCAGILAANPSAATGTYTIAPGGTAITAYCDMTTLGGGWTQVMDDNVDIASYPTRAQWIGPLNSGSPNGGAYSIANLIGQLHSGTNYTFYMQFVGTGGGYQSWTQTANPTSITTGLPTLVGAATLSPTAQGGDAVGQGVFSGLMVSSGNQSYLTADSRNRSLGRYWWSIGEQTAFGTNGIPAFNGASVKRVVLYVK